MIAFLLSQESRVPIECGACDPGESAFGSKRPSPDCYPAQSAGNAETRARRGVPVPLKLAGALRRATGTNEPGRDDAGVPVFAVRD